MKVLIIHWGNNGGGPKFAVNMAEGLLSVPTVDLYASYSHDCDQVERWKRLPIPSFVVRTYRTKIGLLLGLPRLIVTALRLRRYIRVNGITVVYSSMFSIWQSLAVPLYVSKKTQFFPSVHDAVDHPGENHWLKEICRRIEIRYATAVVTYSRHVQSSLAQRFSFLKNVLFVPHGVDSTLAPVRSLVRGQAVVVGFFGRIVEYKGISLFVESLELLHNRGHNVRGLVCGQGDVDPHLVERTRHFIDWDIRWIADEEIATIMDSFDVLALPYIEASQSGVLALGVGRGVPVVATPVGGLGEQVSETGGGVVSTEVSADSFARAVSVLVNDPDLYVSLSRSGIQSAVGGYSWSAVSHSLATCLGTAHSA